MVNGVLFREPNARQLLLLQKKARALAGSLQSTVTGSKRTEMAFGMLQKVGVLLEEDAKDRERNII